MPVLTLHSSHDSNSSIHYSEVTYRHGEHVLQLEARKMGLRKPIKSIYCIGDNVCTDIFGANLYNRYIQGSQAGF